MLTAAQQHRQLHLIYIFILVCLGARKKLSEKYHILIANRNAYDLISLQGLEEMLPLSE